MKQAAISIVSRAVKTLERVASRYAPSRPLSFQAVHILVAMQNMQRNGKRSRERLSRDLALGEGAIKTIVKHMKMHDLIVTTNGGTRLTHKGQELYSELHASMSAESKLPRCSISLGKYNYAIALRQVGYLVKSGIEQRDAAIRMGAIGATTLVYRDGKFMMPSVSLDSLKGEKKIRQILMEKLQPADGDAVIIGTAEKDEKTAELGAKNAALFTLLNPVGK
jgi:Domain of unknown function (DUF4443)